METAILDYISKYISLTEEETTVFTALLKSRRYLKKQFVVQAGEECRYETFVVKGCLRAYFVDPGGDQHIVQFAIENWWISDMASLMNGGPANLNIDAVEDTDVVQIERIHFHEMFDRIPRLDRLYRLMLMKAFVAQQKRIIDNLCMPATERYLHFVQQYRDIEQRVPQHNIASYLGMTPEFLSQIRKRIAGEKRS